MPAYSIALPLITALTGLWIGLRAQDPPTARRLDVQELVLRDAQGARRATLEVTKRGEVVFALHDTSGKTRLTLSVPNDNGAAVAFSDRSGQQVIAVTATDASDLEGPGVAVMVRDPVAGSYVSITNDRTGEALRLYAVSVRGVERAALTLSGHEGDVSLQLCDRQGNVTSSFPPK